MPKARRCIDKHKTFQSLFEPLPMGIIVLGETNNLLYANAFVYTILGLDRTSRLPHFEDLFPALSIDDLRLTSGPVFSRTTLQTPIKSQLPIIFTTYRIRPDDTENTVIAFLDQVSSYQIQTLFEKVTQLTTALSEERYDFTTLLNQLQSGIIWGNYEEVWFTNSRLQNIFTNPHAPMKTITDIFSDSQKIFHYLERKINITNLEIEINHRNRTIPFLINISFVPYHNKPGWLIEILDIEEKKKIENSIMDIAQSIIKERNELRRSQQIFSKELRLAQEIQFSLLPHQEFPSLSYFYLPMESIGGDFLDIVAIDENHIGIFISDVCGHGISSSLLVVMIKQKLLELRALAYYPDHILTKLNKSLFHQLRGYFFTAIYAVYNPSERLLTIANAGHPHPFWGQNNHFGTIATERSQPIGVFPDTKYNQQVIAVHPGEKILFYTDGLLETTNRNHESFEETTLTKSFIKNFHKPSYTFLQSLIEDLRDFHGGPRLDDDIALICLEVT